MEAEPGWLGSGSYYPNVRLFQTVSYNKDTVNGQNPMYTFSGSSFDIPERRMNDYEKKPYVPRLITSKDEQSRFIPGSISLSPRRSRERRRKWERRKNTKWEKYVPEEKNWKNLSIETVSLLLRYPLPLLDPRKKQREMKSNQESIEKSWYFPFSVRCPLR